MPDVGPSEVRVRVGFGGLCGSDLHYFNHGGFGAVCLREPMIASLAKVAATVEEVGAAVTKVKPGDRVAVNPSLPCNLAQMPRGPSEPVPRHALLWECHAHAACSGLLSRGPSSSAPKSKSTG